ncbi:MAG: DEAD/DEAH box helicase [Proteobacteria bacterium]|nr:DEAD/DEAH box helicase [Pseudomonadota bacterium]
MDLDGFHPAVASWFRGQFPAATEVQHRAWRAIGAGSHTLISAPTGSGKTLAAFLGVIDTLVKRGLEGGLADETRILYVSPLKALSNDINKNLQAPLAGIRDKLLESGLPDVRIRALVRTGDTTQSERAKMRRQSPHILVTTPESLYILLTSESGRRMLATVETVIVDEIHALAGNKRGAHLAVSLERLAALCERPPTRVGVSATTRPMEAMVEFLVGIDRSPCQVIDQGHVRHWDLRLELPSSPLEAIMSNEVWVEIYDRLAALAADHRTTIVFVNTRRLAERVARHLADRCGEDQVTSHHGSLSREHRLKAEERLKAGKLKVLVATASLELGIDIGEVDLVCQLGSPRGIARLLQRVGRSGHGVNRVPKGRLVPLSRDELVECAALLDAVARGELDAVALCRKPLDVLSQQIVAEVSMREWEVDALFDLIIRSAPFRELSRNVYLDVLKMLANGFTTQRGRRGAYLHHDRVNGRLRPRRAARLTAVTNGGTIPDQFDYDVTLVPGELFVGTLNEDFAFESMPGDIFQLGNTSYRILKVHSGKVFVEDARGLPPTIPFWFGEAPGRSDELSAAVSRLRRAGGRGAGGRGAGGRGAGESGARQPGGRQPDAGERFDRHCTRGQTACGGPFAAAGRRGTIVRVPGLRPRRPGWTSNGRANRHRAFLRRGRGHPHRRAFALWLSAQPRLGPGAAETLLPEIQFRTPGGGAGGHHRHLAGRRAQFSAGGGGSLPRAGHRRGRSHPGRARRAHLPGPLALERQRRAGGAALPQRQAGAGPLPANGCGGLAGHGVSRPARVRGKPGRRARDSGPSAGGADPSGLPARRHGHRRAGGVAGPYRSRRSGGGVPRTDQPVPPCPGGPERQALCLPRRCARRRAAHPGDPVAPPPDGGAGRGSGPARPRGDPAGAFRSLARFPGRG